MVILAIRCQTGGAWDRADWLRLTAAETTLALNERQPSRLDYWRPFIGDWLLPRIGIHLGTGIISAIVNATIGAVLLLLVVGFLRGSIGGSWGRRRGSGLKMRKPRAGGCGAS